MELTEKTLNSNLVFDGRILKMMVDDVELPDGTKANREIVGHPGGVCVAPIDDDNNLYFVKQYRYPYHEIVLELPAGKLEKGMSPLENGKRELKEEVGAEGYSFISLGQVYPSPGYTQEIIHLYACKIKNIGKQQLDHGEFLNVEKIHINKALEMVLNNQLPDSKTQIAILKLSMLLKSGKI